MAQVWLITGSARGLGRAIAEGVLAAGDKLIATARNPQQLSDLVERYGDNVRAVALDVTDERAALAAIQLAVDVFGRLDVLVNNAGYGNLAAIEDTTVQDFRAQLETNLFGVVNLTKAAIPVMRRQGAGRILQFSSVGGRVGPIGRGAYAAAKWGVEGFSSQRRGGRPEQKPRSLSRGGSARTSRDPPNPFSRTVPPMPRRSEPSRSFSAGTMARSPATRRRRRRR